MRGWGPEGSSLYFNYMYLLGSCNRPGPRKGYFQEAQVIMAQFIPWRGNLKFTCQLGHFLAIQGWANQLMEKDVKKSSFGQVEGIDLESFGQENRKARPRGWDPTEMFKNAHRLQGKVVTSVAQQDGDGEGWPGPLEARMML